MLSDLRRERPIAEADLVLSLGGDGTMLRSVRLLDGASVPLLGVNLGVLGYLTEVEADHVDEALDRFAAGADAGHWHLDERMLLDVTVNGAARRPGAQRGGDREGAHRAHRAVAGADRR